MAELPVSQPEILALRIFGHRAQKLAAGSGKIKKYTKMNGHKSGGVSRHFVMLPGAK